MIERRRYPRHVVSWPVRLWLHDTCVNEGRALDASPNGVRISLSGRMPTALKRRGRRLWVEVRVTPQWKVRRVAEVRNVSPGGLGLRTRKRYPIRLIRRTSLSGDPALP